MTEWEREVVEFLEEMANWNVPYQQRKVKGMMARREVAQRLLADLYTTATPGLENGQGPVVQANWDLGLNKHH